MFFCYIDESGHSGANLEDPRSPLFVMGGIVVHEDKWRGATGDMRAVIKSAAAYLRDAAPPLIRSNEHVRRAWADEIFTGMKRRYKFAMTSDEVIAGMNHFLNSGGFELHATDLVNGHGLFHGTDPRKRARVLHDALAILEGHEIPVLAVVVNGAAAQEAGTNISEPQQGTA